MISFLVEVPRWLFLVALVWGPWVYGGTRPWSMQILDGILGVVVVLWLVGRILRRKRPATPWPLVVSALLVILQGWFMVLNAQAFYSVGYAQFFPLKQLLPFAPGVVDRLSAIPTLINDTAMLGALCFVVDLVQRPVWRTRIWWTAAINGIALMICGIVMKVAGVHIVSYLDPTDIGWDSFAFYFYHGNAGAFINLILPLVAGLTALAFIHRDAVTERAIWMPGLLICIASSVTSLSKAGMAISLGILIVLTIWFIRYNAGSERFVLSRAQLTLLIVGGVLVLGAMLSLGWNAATDRWHALGTTAGREESMTERYLVWQVCFHMMPDSGFWGFGPGSFLICFPHYTAYLNGAVDGIWYYAHEDYLQAIVEWGYVGAVFLAVILFGGIWAGFRRLFGAPLPESDTVLLTVALVALIGVAVHASFDFPLQISSLQLYAVTYLGICWGSPRFEPPATRTRRTRSFQGQSDVRTAPGGML
jgi:O-antigen ligase